MCAAYSISTANGKHLLCSNTSDLSIEGTKKVRVKDAGKITKMS